MCIIAIKPAGIKMPAQATIDNMWYNNDDGAGIMYPDKGQVQIKKGYMKLESFNKAISDLSKKINTTDTPIVFHFRITTAGGTKGTNTHPFPVTEKLPLLQKTTVQAPLAIAHNGMIEITPSKKDISDTMEYVMTQLAPLYQLKKDFYRLEAGKKLVYNAIQSKMAFMDGSSRIETIGKFESGNDGLIYSNNSYQALTRYSKWDMWDDYSTRWHETTKGKYMTWLGDDDGYVVIGNGDIVSANLFLSDRAGTLYVYDYETDMAIPIDGRLYSHEGRQINGYSTSGSEYIEIDNGAK